MITETQLKLRDAGIQMKLALRNSREDDFFRSCINSFITAARSVTMVMERESAHSPALLDWYKKQSAALRQEPVTQFFNAQRVHTIHRGNVHPQKHGFNFSVAGVSQRVGGAGGSIEQLNIRGEGEVPFRAGDVVCLLSETEAIVWTFPEAEKYLPDSSTNVFRLCEAYFVRLKVLVHEWLAVRSSLSQQDSNVFRSKVS